MPRPVNCRRVAYLPKADYFKPRGMPLSALEQVILTVDELEAIRLADFEGLYQADAAKKMNVSRQTLGRILLCAHKKIADALVNGKALKIEGGQFEMKFRNFGCRNCGFNWQLEFGTPRPRLCPQCRGRLIHRIF